jgi:apolipoprotein N-acyltransferase
LANSNATLQAKHSSGAASAARDAQGTRATPSRGALRLALAGSALMFLALPPIDGWPLAWVAPLPWLLLARQTELPSTPPAAKAATRAGRVRARLKAFVRRPYFAIWLAGFVFWLAAVYWLTLPHWATSFGWAAISFYLAFYVPAFVGLTRVAVHRLGVSIVVAAPVVWTGLELLRGHLLSGFSMALLGHTQHRWLALIQIADVAGAYAVSFLVMLVAACLARAMPWGESRTSWWPLALAAAAVGGVLAYGRASLSVDHSRPGPRVALIQGSIPSEFKYDPTRNERILKEYLEQTRAALAQHKNVELVVWPETMWRETLIAYSQDAQPAEGATWTRPQLEQAARESQKNLQLFGRHFGVNALLGVDTIHYGPGRTSRYNSAVFVTAEGQVSDRYDKMHRVMFGEYVPFADRIPWLYKMTPLTGGIEAGTHLPAFKLGETRLAANICFESCVPHLIRRQVAELRGRGEEPDILVNLTNDGWFHGSSELDMHLACGVFRAVELRKPFLAAANTGFSAWVDSNGLIRQRGPRQEKGFIVGDVRLDSRTSWYSRHGDWPAGICLAACAVLGLWGIAGRRR